EYRFVGYLPRRDAERRALAAALARFGDAIVAFESPRRLPGSLAVLAEAMPDRPVAVCRELTKRFEEVVRGRLDEVAEAFRDPPRGEITLVLGRFVVEVRDVSEVAIRTVAELVEAGVPRKQAVDVVARLTGAARNTLYRASLQQLRDTR
nr:16S rRNA (cytidine(1402)-2'-O)-methyltransferase [Actinomycetota bacterium]